MAQGPRTWSPSRGHFRGLERAAVAWGIGRELYRYPRILIEGEHRHIPKAVLERLSKLPEAVAQGKPLPEVIRLNERGRASSAKYPPPRFSTPHPQGLEGLNHRLPKLLNLP